MLKLLFNMVETGLVPDWVIRAGIRNRNRARLKREARVKIWALHAMRKMLQETPVATHTAAANEQHYELPPAFLIWFWGPGENTAVVYTPRA